jgi:hypothetical protein
MTHRRKCLHNTCCAQYRLTNSRKTCTNAGDLQQFRTGPQENRRHSGIGLHTPASVHYGTATEIQAQRAATLDAAYKANPARFQHQRPTPPKLPTVAWINEPTPEALIKSA